jgi:hypothetical protein
MYWVWDAFNDEPRRAKLVTAMLPGDAAEDYAYNMRWRYADYSAQDVYVSLAGDEPLPTEEQIQSAVRYTLEPRYQVTYIAREVDQ